MSARTLKSNWRPNICECWPAGITTVPTTVGTVPLSVRNDAIGSGPPRAYSAVAPGWQTSICHIAIMPRTWPNWLSTIRSNVCCCFFYFPQSFRLAYRLLSILLFIRSVTGFDKSTCNCVESCNSIIYSSFIMSRKPIPIQFIPSSQVYLYYTTKMVTVNH